MSNALSKQIATAQSLAASFNSEITTIKTVDNVAYTIQTASVTDNTGTFGVQFRAYKDDNTVGSWIDLTLSSTPTLADADDGFLINLNQLPPGQVRLAFTAAGGTPDGTAEIWISGKQLGRG